MAPMAKKKTYSARSRAKEPAKVNEPKVAVSYRLSRGRIAQAQQILGSPSATATIEDALDAVVFRRELMDGVRRTFGLPIADAFPDAMRRRRR
jgi:hypothetical protein